MIAPLGKYMPCKHKDLKAKPQNPRKKQQSIEMLVFNLSTRESEIGGNLGLSNQPTGQLVRLRPVRKCPTDKAQGN